MRRAALSAGLAALTLAGCGGTATVTVTVTRTRTVTTTAPATGTGTTPAAAACTGADLRGTFAVIPGSAGAGQISYALTVTNSSNAACFVSGIPDVRLLDASGAALPTHVSAAHPGQGTAARIVLAPGDSASAQARFSPDVPGVGDRQSGRCQPKATSMRVSTTGPETFEAPLRPPTSVCEQGSLRFDLFASR